MLSALLLLSLTQEPLAPAQRTSIGGHCLWWRTQGYQWLVEHTGVTVPAIAALAGVGDAVPCNLDGGPTDCIGNDLESLMLTSTGHALGLDYSSNPASTMGYLPQGLTRRLIDPQTLEGVISIYPPGKDARTCDGG